MDTDVIVVGAGPTGLLLAAELALCGVKPIVLERQPHPRELPKANGLGGLIVRMLEYRGLLERLPAGTFHGTAPGFPFGGVNVDFTPLKGDRMQLLLLPQPRLERLLGERADELGAQVRRGHALVALQQDATSVTAEIQGPEGDYRLRARYLIGCDGGGSTVRALAQIPFPGTTYPEVTRLGHLAMPDSVTLLDNGDLDVPGIGVVRSGFTRTERGMVAIASFTPEVLLVSATEDDPAAPGDDQPVTLPELRASLTRVLGADLPLGEPIWLSRFRAQARQAQRYRDGRVFLAGDAAHLFPTGGIALNVGLLDAVDLGWKLAAAVNGWAPTDLLDTYHGERHPAGARALRHSRAQAALASGGDEDAIALREIFQELLRDEQPVRRVCDMLSGAEIRYPAADTHPLVGAFAPDLALSTADGRTSVAGLMRSGRPVLLDLADRADIRETAGDWADRVDVRTADADDPVAAALLIRPDARIAWAVDPGASADSARTTLRDALTRWFGQP
ncbi:MULTISPECIES: FAD-dependent monooxygenase [unclassified Nocardia]|uniref:FAD-dependent monooxygenase n=1 Tax=unclassified Nocardia TaxID=2637762 RepID=UPI001CE3B78C|nr:MULTISPECIES: FAD-dependent monooxygenase [unclassified Nocardia]